MKTLMKQITVALAVIALSTTSFAFASSKSSTSYKRSTTSVKKVQSYKAKPTPVKTVKTVKRPVKKVEYDYYPLQDCSRHITVGFNGYKCIDRD